MVPKALDAALDPSFGWLGASGVDDDADRITPQTLDMACSSKWAHDVRVRGSAVLAPPVLS